MRFAVKDLMITVLPVQGNAGAPLTCDGGCTCCSHCTGCTNVTHQTHGTPCTPNCPAVVLPRSLEQLAIIKAQLRESLQAVEAREREVAESLRPRSRGEVELVRRYLTDALGELDADEADEAGEG
ncbi:hypothetical protein [Bailinhaonella thermotolerans]|nr:hypothetical protein [Bailinhaonella thermotolerans]